MMLHNYFLMLRIQFVTLRNKFVMLQYFHLAQLRTETRLRSGMYTSNATFAFVMWNTTVVGQYTYLQHPACNNISGVLPISDTGPPAPVRVRWRCRAVRRCRA